jgi:hypothetical protein
MSIVGDVDFYLVEGAWLWGGCGLVSGFKEEYTNQDKDKHLE